ncbi:MAG TPA: AAA family ATPase, partial [Chthoniobacteraceae bacterium]|nr:AAA family ATPase [Chthoniobacteraceae bacterium]
MPQIRVKVGYQQGQVFPLEDKQNVIGRDPQSDIPLDVESPASRHHATIYKTGSQWRLHDEGSMNGTLLNGSRVSDNELKDGDKIVIGTAIFVFEDGAEMLAPPPLTAAANGNEISVEAALTEELIPEEQRAQIQEVVGEMSVKTRLIEAEISKIIIGQTEIIGELLTAIISNGHVLMIGMPGLAKTLLVRTVAKALDLEFRRIQFTPDLMPSDITGTDILEVDEASGRKEYRFIHGPIFTNILLADEINRTPPKTQAALLEAMQEHRVT